MNSKMLNALTIVSIMIMSAVLLNCSGDDGAVGPKGEDGADGNANVIYSDWDYAKDFKDSSVDNSNIKIAHIKAPEITVDVMNKGVVFVYMNYGGGPMVLPYTSGAGGKVSTISYYMRLGQLIPYRFTHDNSNGTNLSTLLQYRYIIVPANTAATPPANPGGRTSGGTVAGLDYSDYNAVCKYYGIPL